MAATRRVRPPDWRKEIVFWGVHAVALAPGLWLLWAFFTSNLGTDPVNTLNNITGRTAMIALLGSLACTPLNTLFGFREALSVRRALGLLNFVGLDYGFDVGFILADGIVTKPYIVVGFAALLLMAPLAITSTKGWMKRLGRNWKKLHYAAYVIAVLVIFHFLWQAKAAERLEPLLYGLGLALLLIVRIPAVRRSIARLRSGK
jgi:sulfoxide reductase heme-binding subunit YedZ